jgi:hypothetical protein
VESSNQVTPVVDTELARHHKAASTTIVGLIVATILLSVVAFLGKAYFRQQPNIILDMTFRITVLIFGLGSVALRRTKFSAMRLKDIGALEGASGLLRTLERTTLKIALIGAAVAAIGFVATLMTGDASYTYIAVIVAIAVLLYGYPTLTSWQRILRLFAADLDENPHPKPTL